MTLTPSPQEPAQALGERIKQLARAYGSARADEAWEDEPAFFASKKKVVQETFAALFESIDRLVQSASPQEPDSMGASPSGTEHE
jgi:hypothetical protein